MNILIGLALILVCPVILHRSAGQNYRRWLSEHRREFHAYVDNMPSGSAWAVVAILVAVGVWLIMFG